MSISEKLNAAAVAGKIAPGGAAMDSERPVHYKTAMDQGSSALKVVIVGTGTIGRAVAKAVQTDAELKLVAAVDISDAARQNAGEDFTGVTITDDVEQIAEADIAIVTAGRKLDRIAPTLRQLMAKKVRVVSDCAELVWPWLRHPHLSDVLANEATKAGVAIVGTGTHPGVLSATLPLLLASTFGKVRRVAIKRTISLDTARPSVKRQAGLGLTSDQFRKLATDGVVGLPGTGESVVLIAQGLGRHPMRAEVRTAIRPMIENDRVAGVAQHSAWRSTAWRLTSKRPPRSAKRPRRIRSKSLATER
ncbi:MAG: hypothetical protein QM754_16525 [Tepidisphaeraceae bacterium]